MESLSIYLLSLSLALVTYLTLKDHMIKLLKSKNLLVENYKGKAIVNGAGIVLLVPCIVATAIMVLFENNTSYILFIFVVVILSLTGLIDDLLGVSSTKGLMGHLKGLTKGEFSTGILKAIAGLVIGAVVAYFNYSSIFGFFMDILIFSLSVNFINLLDLRPGRAAKAYFLFTVCLLFISGFSEAWVILPVYIGLFFYLNGEMEEEYMLGDTGASLLGGTCGYYSVLTLSMGNKAVLGFLLVVLHITTEYWSLSVVIEKIPTLRRLDRLGRKD
ncbi:MAG TPA: hypothetical protein VFD33_07520 [Bacillota bacterium]|nr:hypothetical protein [Bacillota bacterium]